MSRRPGPEFQRLVADQQRALHASEALLRDELRMEQQERRLGQGVPGTMCHWGCHSSEAVNGSVYMIRSLFFQNKNANKYLFEWEGLLALCN